MTDLLIKKLTSGDVSSPEARNKCGTAAGVFGIICNLLLCALKISIGALSGSISIVADGLNNLSDMGSSVITMVAFKLSGKPADKNHPYGYGRIEYLSAFVVSLLILLVGFELFKESGASLLGGEKAPEYSVIAIVILIISVAAKFGMYLFNRNLGKRINSETLFATAQDCINDSIATTVILVSVVVSKLFTVSFNLDAVMGIGVSLFILYSGIKSAKETLDTILGTAPEQEIIDGIKDCVMSFDTFLGLHDLIIHNYGPNRIFASVHVEVPQDVDIVACHEKIDICERFTYEKTGVELVIHMDPIETDNEEINTTRAAIEAKLKTIHEHLTLHDFRMTPKGEAHTNFIFDVVVPNALDMTKDELKKEIDKTVKSLNPNYYCVITFDNDYTGR
ncbi:MAG: cation diffusion facilitator family transporter [Clostridiales bacterium]|nr:cation diffusion facilitator family transporter [Candidatus Equinaster intestinalis]